MSTTWAIIFTFSGVFAVFAFGTFIGFRNGYAQGEAEGRATAASDRPVHKHNNGE